MSEDQPRRATADGSPTIDPTRNVLDLVAAAILRQDDLRAATAQHAREQRDLESAHVREIIAIRADSDARLRAAETNRIDAIRAVDVSAAQRASEVAAQQATTLATTQNTLAETLRKQVEASASAAATSLAAALAPIQKDVSELRTVQFQQQGERSAKSDSREQSQWGTGQVISILLAVVAIAFSFYVANAHSAVQAVAPVVIPK